MINVNRSFDVKNGVILKASGEPKIGIHHGSASPELVDDGSVHKGSIYIRSNGELWQKNGLLSSDWSLKSSSAGSIDTNYFSWDSKGSKPFQFLPVSRNFKSNLAGHTIYDPCVLTNFKINTEVKKIGSLNVLVNGVVVHTFNFPTKIKNFELSALTVIPIPPNSLIQFQNDLTLELKKSFIEIKVEV